MIVRNSRIPASVLNSTASIISDASEDAAQKPSPLVLSGGAPPSLPAGEGLEVRNLEIEPDRVTRKVKVAVESFDDTSSLSRFVPTSPRLLDDEVGYII